MADEKGLNFIEEIVEKDGEVEVKVEVIDEIVVEEEKAADRRRTQEEEEAWMRRQEAAAKRKERVKKIRSMQPDNTFISRDRDTGG